MPKMKGLGELQLVYDFLCDRAGKHFSPEEINEGMFTEDLELIKKHLDELRKLHAINHKMGKYYCLSVKKQ